MRRFALVAVVALALAVPPRRAMAGEPMTPDPDPVAPAPPAPPSRVWYGPEVFVADAVGVGLMAAGAIAFGGSGQNEGLLVALPVGGVISLVVPPLIHVAHRQARVAGLTLSLRLVLSLAGAALGSWAGSQSSSCALVAREGAGPADEDSIGACESDKLGGTMAGLAAGMGLASLVDVTLLAWEEPGPVQPDRPPPAPPSFRWTPTVSMAKDSGQRLAPTLGIAGTF